MNNRSRIAIIALFCLAPQCAAAQGDTLSLTLQECIRMAWNAGPAGVMARSSYESKESSSHSLIATYYPQLSLSGDVPGYSRSIIPIILPDGSTVFTPQSQASSSVGVALTQKIPFTGGELSFSSGLSRIDLMEARSQYYRSNPLTVQLRQPLFQINSMLWDLRAQGIRDKMAPRELAEAMEECALDITNKFFDLYLALMNAANAALNLAINDTLYKISVGRYNVGKIAENDLLQSELAFLNARTQRENALVGLDRSRENLRAAIGETSNAPIVLVPPTPIPATSVDPAVALAQARQNRSDALNFDLQMLSADRRVVQAESDNSFNATMTASLGYNQRAPVLPDAYANLLNQQQFSLGFSIPIFRWGAGSAAVDAARADRTVTHISVEQQKRDFEQEVLYQSARLNLLARQVAVAAKADTIAQRRFDVAKDRYLIGKIDIPNLFLSQSEKDNARRAGIQTLWDFWSTHFRVRRLTLYDFEAGRPLVTPP